VYQYNMYAEQRMPNSVLLFTGITQKGLENNLRVIKEARRENPTIERHMALALDKEKASAQMLRVIDSMVDMDAKEMMLFYREATAVRFGVSLSHLGITTPGKLGNETETVEVSFDTIEDALANVDEELTRFLCPRLGVTDWRVKAKSPKKDDLLRKAQIEGQKAATIAALRTARVEFDLDADWGINITGLGEMPEQQGGFMPFQQSRLPPPLFLEPGKPGSSMSKALGSRGIAQMLSIPGIRSIENLLVAGSIKAYNTRVAHIVKGCGGKTKGKLKKEIRVATDELTDDLTDTAQEHTKQMYIAGSTKAAEEGDVPPSFTQKDENALNVMLTRGHGIIPTLKDFGDDTKKKFFNAIEEGFEEGLDTKQIVDKMEEVSDGRRWKLEQIARSETTRIANMGRFNKYRELFPKDGYNWIPRSPKDSDNPCAICRAIANGGQAEIWGKMWKLHGNPYTLDELEKITNGGLPHPNCVCTAARDVQ